MYESEGGPFIECQTNIVDQKVIVYREEGWRMYIVEYNKPLPTNEM